MNLRSILIGAALLCLSTVAGAQDLKPVKDKSTKLFGYQDKSKNWVIPPSYSAAKRFNGGFAIVEQEGLKGLIDEGGNWILKPEYNDIGKFGKAGLCEVMRKEGKTRYRGVANTAGQLVVPAECQGISIYQSQGIINAQRDVDIPRWGRKALWGVYDANGTQIFEPQFSSSPSWSGGSAIAQSAFSGLYGVINDNGSVPLPFDFLAAETAGSGFELLSSDFVQLAYDSRYFKTSEYAYPGYVAPYDPMGDAVRAAAWRVGPLGVRLHRNSLKYIELGQNARGRSATCSDLPIDWGWNRFVRLEPYECDEGTPGAMLNPEGNNYYTVKAILYEADGRPVGEISSWGWLDAECSDGVIYKAQGADTWIALKDINCLALPSFTISLGGLRSIDHGDVLGGLGLHNYEISRMCDPNQAVRRYEEIREGENAGITSYLPRPAPELRSARALDDAMRSPLFRRHFRMGQVVNCKTNASETGVTLTLSKNLTCTFEDEFRDPRFRMKGEEEIFWGPSNARTVRLSLERVDSRKSPDAMKDDLMGTDMSFELVVSLYEEDGRYLRTLGVVPAPDYYSEGVLVLEPLGIAIMEHRSPGASRLELKGARKLPHSLSALKAAK